VKPAQVDAEGAPGLSAAAVGGCKRLDAPAERRMQRHA
jgi:hypothetical protein